MSAVEADLSAPMQAALSELPVMPKPATKPAPFALNAIEALEAMIQSQVVNYLRIEQARGRVGWFIETDRLVQGMLSGGKRFALEVKRPGESVTPDQMAFIEAARLDGGIAAAVRHWEDVKSLLWGEINPARDQRCYADQYAGVV